MAPIIQSGQISLDQSDFVPIFVSGKYKCMRAEQKTMREFLEERVIRYNNPGFIDSDPVQIPHMFIRKEEREIAGFLTAVISWGNRTSIINSARRIMQLFDHSPYDFIMNYRDQDLKKISGFLHRTFNSDDLITFIPALRKLYKHNNGLEGIFTAHKTDISLQPAIHEFKKEFFNIPHLERTRKHLPDPFCGSAAKRINMFLRWMVRKDHAGVDFGLWKDISASALSCPLDIHSGKVARKLGLLKRKQNDAKAVAELDHNLREMDPYDPVKYDYALFGLGVYEGFGK